MSNPDDPDRAFQGELEPNASNQADLDPSVPGQSLHGEDEKAHEDDSCSDHDSGTNLFEAEHSGSQLQRCEWPGGGSGLPDTFQTSRLLFYERFKAYQDYMLDCKPSEVRAFIADYLEKVVVLSDWLAVWSTDVFDVLVEVRDVDLRDLKACVKLVLPMQCDIRGCELTKDTLRSLLEVTQHKVTLQELHVVYEESGELDQTALALEHLRFFYKHIWREWDEEDEDDDFDYFVRCVEPRLRLCYDILEDRVPAGLVEEYQSLLESCSHCFQQFSVLRNSLSPDSDSELDNVSMVEGLKLCDQLDTFKRKLHIIESPLLRYVLAYKGNVRSQSVVTRGPRESSKKVVHVVSASCSSSQLQSLLNTRLTPLCSADDTEIQFHREPASAVDSCYEGDVVVVLPGVYSVSNSIYIPDSITIEGFGFPDEVVIEKRNTGDSFLESTGAAVKISNIKFIQHGAIEGILCVGEGALDMENCVLQCETTGVIVRTSARLNMSMCDLYGSKGAGLEIYPGSICCLVSNGIHHCKDGILIKDFADEMEVMPSITMENNVIHNNEGYGVHLVKPKCAEDPAGLPAEEKQQGDFPSMPSPPTSSTSETAEPETAPPSTRKWHLGRQLSRNKDISCIWTTQDLKDHPIFVSIQGNLFKRNGLGDFGTFYY
ncbi:SHC SH2 domain-binding protein 1 isoform X2 [Salarias fasciatus]|uniref:SHC SH2 domain-binding protein 1 isoform X2 n=1 Tax=Salarias fasciatus TaxID=181472 RepID=UPI001176C0BC|nr:SHC SH2 domain-binding protein 1 isoform X2 [Salarias fasciatus]